LIRIMIASFIACFWTSVMKTIHRDRWNWQFIRDETEQISSVTDETSLSFNDGD
jgi:hypothetical protein